MSETTGGTFRSFRARNFRLWFIGQTISMVGFYAQTVAQALLVLDLGGSGAVLGIATALSFVPMLVVGPWAGVLSDRFDKRRLMFCTQSSMLVFAVVLGVLAVGHRVTIGWVLVLAALSGTAWAFDQPCRRTIVVEMVPEEDVANAVSLNSAVMLGSKVIGPVVAGLLISGVGIGWCFVVNAVSSVPALVLLACIRPQEMRTPPLLLRSRGQIADGFRYAYRTPEIRTPLVLLGLVGLAGFNWNVLIPLLATRDLDGGPAALTVITGAMAAGAVLGSLWLARRYDVDNRFIAMWVLLFGITNVLLGASPSLLVASLAATTVGATSTIVGNAAGTAVQLRALSVMRGRAMALYAMALFGSVAICGTVSGWLAEQLGARTTFVISGLAVIVVGTAALAACAEAPAPVEVSPAIEVPALPVEL